MDNLFGSFSGLSEAHRRIAELCKDNEDRSMGWAFDEVKTLTVKYRDATIGELSAEVCNVPVFGFSPVRLRWVVRIQVDVDTLPAETDDFPDGEFSLYEGDTPFGDEKSWKYRNGRILEDSWLDIWLEN